MSRFIFLIDLVDAELYDEVLVVVALESFVNSEHQGRVVMYPRIALLDRRVGDVRELERLYLFLRP